MHPTTFNPRHLDRARFTEALQRAMHTRGYDQYTLAQALGVSQPAVSDWLRQKKQPGRKNLENILTLLEIAWDEVCRPESSGSRTSLSRDQGAIDPDAVVLIPRNGFAGAGEGVINEEVEEQADPYPRYELIRLTGANPDHFRALTVIGDSLAPEIQPNSTVLYHPTETFRGDGLYVVSIDDVEIVKRVQQFSDGTLVLLPINPEYAPEMLDPLRDADTPNTYRSERGHVVTLRVVGKVVYYGKSA